MGIKTNISVINVFIKSKVSVRITETLIGLADGKNLKVVIVPDVVQLLKDIMQNWKRIKMKIKLVMQFH